MNKRKSYLTFRVLGVLVDNMPVCALSLHGLESENSNYLTI